MSDGRSDPERRNDEFEDAAFDLLDCAAVVETVCEMVQRQTADHLRPADMKSYRVLLLTPAQARAFDRSINDLTMAAEQFDRIRGRHL